MRREGERRAGGVADPPGEPPWGRLYALVLGTLAVLVLLFYFFGRAFG